MIIISIFAFVFIWEDVHSKENTPAKIVKPDSDWKRVLEDCPDSSCAVVFDEDEYLSYLKVRFVPDTERDLFTRRYMWFYTSEGKEVGRIIISEYEGHWVQINKGPGTCNNIIKFTSTNTTNEQVGFRYLVIRATANGVHVTFPDNGTWAVCAEWRVQRVAFDKFWRVDATYTTVSHDEGTDLCAATVNNGTRCEETPYCTADGFCSSLQSEGSCEKIDNSSYCSSCNIKHTVSCNSTTHCIAPNWICNGVEECDNGEDEMNCPSSSVNQECQERGGQMTNDECLFPENSAKRLINETMLTILCFLIIGTGLMK